MNTFVVPRWLRVDTCRVVLQRYGLAFPELLKKLDTDEGLEQVETALMKAFTRDEEDDDDAE